MHHTCHYAYAFATRCTHLPVLTVPACHWFTGCPYATTAVLPAGYGSVVLPRLVRVGLFSTTVWIAVTYRLPAVILVTAFFCGSAHCQPHAYTLLPCVYMDYVYAGYRLPRYVLHYIYTVTLHTFAFCYTLRTFTHFTHFDYTHAVTRFVVHLRFLRTRVYAWLRHLWFTVYARLVYGLRFGLVLVVAAPARVALPVTVHPFTAYHAVHVSPCARFTAAHTRCVWFTAFYVRFTVPFGYAHMPVCPVTRAPQPLRCRTCRLHSAVGCRTLRLRAAPVVLHTTFYLQFTHTLVHGSHTLYRLRFCHAYSLDCC